MPPEGCTPEPVLAAFAAGRLAPSRADEVRAHLKTCTRCQHRVGELEAALRGDADLRGDTEQRTLATNVGPPEHLLPPERPAEVSSPLIRGDAVGRYLVLKTLGEGGMGVVYQAYDPELDRRVALKLLRQDVVFDESDPSMGRARLLREAQAMARLQHPNVVSVFDAGTFDKKVFLAMELVEGSTAKIWMRSKRQPWREVLRVFSEAGRGLIAAHSAGMIHRDFKPDNVLLPKEGQARVTDFGLARAVDSQEPELRRALALDADDAPSEGGDLATPLTRTGTIMGTPAYMAPEQVVAAPVDARTDQFSFCVSVYEALYGERPFKTKADPRKPPKLRDIPPNSDVPAWIRKILLRGLEFDPEKRWPDMASLLAALADDPAVRRKRALRSGALGFSIAVLVGTIAWLVTHRPPDICADPASQLAGVWDANAHAAAKVAFAQAGGAGADTAWAFAEKAMDHTAAQWVAAYGQACRDARETHKDTESSLNLRLDCLARQRTDLAAVVSLFEHATSEVVGAASGAATSLPQAAACQNARALAVVEPPDPDQLPKVKELQVRLASAKALTSAGQAAAALAALTPLAADAKALNYEPLEAEVLVSLGDAQSETTQFGPSLATFDRALDLAMVARTDELASRAAARRVAVASLAGKSSADVDSLIAQAKLLVARGGTESLAALELERGLSIAADRSGRTDEAITHDQRAAELTAKIYGEETPQTVRALNNYGAGLDGVGRYDEGMVTYRKAIAISEHMFGPEDDNIRIVWLNIAEDAADLDRPADSQAALDHVLALSAKHGDNLYTALTLASAARALAGAGKAGEAQKRLDQAINVAEKGGFNKLPDMGDILRFACEVHRLLGKPDAAVKDYEQLLPIEGHELEPDSASWVAYLQAGGAAYLAAGQPAKSREILEQGLELARKRPVYPRWVPQMQFDLAQALIQSGGDPKRAASLAQLSRDALAKLPDEKPLLAEVDAWRVHHR